MEKTEPMNKVLQNLLSEVAKYYAESKRKENERWERGESFNIFNTIGLRSEEVRLHSAFIGELLNPRGSHGASSLFLKAFLEVMGIEDGYLDYEDCSPNILERVIGTVTATEGGRIDIIIEDGEHAITERQTWSDLFVGITIYDEPKRADKLFKKDYVLLNCLDQSPNEYYPYGWNFLPSPIRNWGYHITEEIVNGDVFNWVKNKFDEILSELNERNLRMP